MDAVPIDFFLRMFWYSRANSPLRGLSSITSDAHVPVHKLGDCVTVGKTYSLFVELMDFVRSNLKRLGNVW